ncbi:hypothetical protein EJ07DRAFT_151504 [Lizonia empirigonia]|nr:hypothetical protein EJ07DRAFT_151504 [Lizonia empirigonia]
MALAPRKAEQPTSLAPSGLARELAASCIFSPHVQRSAAVLSSLCLVPDMLSGGSVTLGLCQGYLVDGRPSAFRIAPTDMPASKTPVRRLDSGLSTQGCLPHVAGATSDLARYYC